MKTALVKLILQHVFLRDSFKDEFPNGLVTYDMCSAWVERYYPGETTAAEIDECLNELNIINRNKPNWLNHFGRPENGTYLRAYNEEYYKIDSEEYYPSYVEAENNAAEEIKKNIQACDKRYGDKVIPLPRDHDRYCLDCMTRAYGARRHRKKNNKKHTKDECRENIKKNMIKFVEM